MHLAPLPRCALEVPLDGAHQAPMIIAGNQLHAPQAAFLQAAEQRVVGGFGFRVGDVNRQAAPAARPP